jgi:putative tryptophan/tyrosine transport system substrate-binding protein
MRPPPYRPGMERRRFLLISLAGVLATPVGGAAQRVPEVGLLAFGTKRLSLNGERMIHELREALRGFGWIDGQSIRLRSQFADLNEDRLATLAQEFVHRRVDVILAIGTPATEAARRATMSIPIVMSGSADPIAAGLARNLARPDGNVTGTSLVLTETAGKRLQLLKEVRPQLTRTAVLHSGTRFRGASQLDELRVAAPRLGVEIQEFVYRGVDALPAQFAEIRNARAESLIVIASHTIDEARTPLAQFALKHRLPTALAFREYVEAGGLMSYGPNLSAIHQRAAYYIDRLLRGTKPADLPIEQATTFELVINLKTSKALGLTIPPSLLARADQVIE